MQVVCPTCQNPVQWCAEEKWRPFCSERCRLIDLGDWFNEEHRISGEGGTFDENNNEQPGRDDVLGV